MEEVVEGGLRQFLEIGRALLEINERRLYRSTHATFVDYALGRWNLSGPRAYQLMQAARLSTDVDISSEAQARELAGLPGEMARAVFDDAAAGSPSGVPTGPALREARAKVAPRAGPGRPPDEMAARRAVTDFPELGWYIETGRPASAVRLAAELRGFPEVERSMRLRGIRAAVDAERRKASNPPPPAKVEPDWHELADQIFAAANRAAQEIARCGGPATVAAAMKQGVDSGLISTWHDQFEAMAQTGAELAGATKATLRSVK